MVFTIALFLLVAVEFGDITAQDYCGISKVHTMCIYQGVGAACAPRLAGGVSQEEKAAILKTHNDLRQRVAQGEETLGLPGPQPPAANMRRLAWDDEIASVAQRLADQCVYGHDACRDVARFGVGQNLALFTGVRNVSNWPAAVKLWYDEVKDYSNLDINPFRFSKPTGHYTAFVWAKTYLVGCGYVKFYKNGTAPFYHMYVCNYAPFGNLIGSPLYQVGSAASQCPEGTNPSTNSGYPGLCS